MRAPSGETAELRRIRHLIFGIGSALVAVGLCLCGAVIYELYSRASTPAVVYVEIIAPTQTDRPPEIVYVEVPAPTQTASIPARVAPTALYTPNAYGTILFCVERPTAATGDVCARPVSRLPSGISIFYYSRSFANIPRGTAIHSRWYRDGQLLDILNRTIVYGEGAWNTEIVYSWVTEVPSFELWDGLYTVELFFSNATQPYQRGAVYIGDA